MKCPECHYNQKVKYGMVCNNCGYEFALNPKSRGMRSDFWFRKLLEQASADGTRFFTKEGLYFAYCKRLSRWSKAEKFNLGCVSLFFILPALVFAEGGLWIGVCVLILLAFLFYMVAVPWFKRPNRSNYERMLETYRAKYPIDNLIEKPALHMRPPVSEHGDIYDYGVERIVFVNRDLLVDLLVKNGFHTEHKALVLSGDGYPRYLKPKAAELLQQHPDLPIFLLHDADDEGIKLRDQMRSLDLPIEGHPIKDLGVFPDDVRRLKSMRHVPGKQHHIPLDLLGYGMIAGGMAAAFVGGLSFAEMLDEEKTRGIAESYGGFG